MNTKLTLTIEERIIQRAKKYAKQNGRSLSGIIENYLKIITQEGKQEKVIEKISQLLVFIDVLQMDKEVIVNALNSKFKDIA